MRPSIRSNVSRSSTVSAIVRRCVNVVLLDREKLTIYIEGKAKVRDVFSQVCENLSLRESEYFGLAQLVDGEYHFVDLDAKLQKLLPAEWKASRKVTIGDPQPLTTFHFRVQFYVEHAALLKERTTRYLYYLQMRDNLLNFSHLVAEERCFVFAAYALQADHGNCHDDSHNYFDPREYFPAWVLSKHGADYIRRNMPQMHRDLHGMTKMEAQMHYIKDVSAPPTAHNLHFYQLKKRKSDALGTAWLGICTKGLEIYEEMNGFKSLLSTFLWASIAKLYFEKKKFEIRAIDTPSGRKFTYYTGSDERSKYLLAQCQSTHLFHMSVQPRLAELRHMEVEDRRFREMYVNGDAHDMSERTSLCRKTSVTSSRSSGSRRAHRQRASPRPACLTQRISVTSTASSNTTSGIASDIGKQYTSFEESEDDPGQEIIIDSPPRFVSTTPGLTTYPRGYSGGGAAGAGAASGVKTQQNWPFTLPKAQYVRETKPPATVAATATAVTPAYNVQQPVARSSSNMSQHSSGRLAAVVVPPPMRMPSPVAAEARIQRLLFSPMMTVSSGPVPPLKGEVVSGVASTSVTPVRPVNTYVAESVTAPPSQHMMLAQPMTYVASMPQRCDPPVFQVAHSYPAPGPAPTQSLQQGAYQQGANMQQQVSNAIAGPYMQPGQGVMVAPARRPTTLHTSAMYANNSYPVEAYTAVPPQLAPTMPLPPNDAYRRSSLQSTPQMSPLEPLLPVVSVVPGQRSLPPSPGCSTGTALRKLSAPQMSAPVVQQPYCVYTDMPSDTAGPAQTNMVLSETSGQVCQKRPVPTQHSPGEGPAWGDQSLTESVSSEEGGSTPQKTSPVSAPSGSGSGSPPVSVVNPECPLHGIQQQNVAAEIRGLNNKNLSLPMLTGLCNDASLVTMCTCYHGNKTSQSTVAKKHLSYAEQRRVASQMEAGTVARPFSWHSENFNLDQTLRVFDDVLLSDNDVSHASSASSPSESPSMNSNMTAVILDSSVVHQSTTSNGSSVMMETQANGLTPRFPAKITSGGHSPYNGKAIGPQKASLGIA